MLEPRHIEPVALASTASGPFLAVAVTIDITLVSLAFYLEKTNYTI